MKKVFYLYVFLLLSLIIFPASKTKKPLIKKNKNSNKMELVFILDRSGSMSGLESDTIGGFNSVLEKTKQSISIKNIQRQKSKWTNKRNNCFI